MEQRIIGSAALALASAVLGGCGMQPDEKEATRKRVEELGGTLRSKAWEVYVYLADSQVTDADLKGMNVTTLDLARTNITDAGVEKLQAALPKCRVGH